MSARTYTPEPMKYHGPGWSIDLVTGDDGAQSGDLLQVWAPRARRVKGSPSDEIVIPAREGWQASWVALKDGEDVGGGFGQAATFHEAVMLAFARHRDYLSICKAFADVTEGLR